MPRLPRPQRARFDVRAEPVRAPAVDSLRRLPRDRGFRQAARRSRHQVRDARVRRQQERDVLHQRPLRIHQGSLDRRAAGRTARRSQPRREAGTG